MFTEEEIDDLIVAIISVEERFENSDNLQRARIKLNLMRSKNKIHNINYMKCPGCSRSDHVTKSVNEKKYHCFWCDTYFI